MLIYGTEYVPNYEVNVLETSPATLQADMATELAAAGASPAAVSSVSVSTFTAQPATAAPAADPADLARHRALLIGLVAIAIACCVCIACAVSLFMCAKRNRRTKGFDRVQSDQMYNLEEPNGPTDSMINTSPYGNFSSGYASGMHHQNALEKNALEPTGSFPMIPPLVAVPRPNVSLHCSPRLHHR